MAEETEEGHVECGDVFDGNDNDNDDIMMSHDIDAISALIVGGGGDAHTVITEEEEAEEEIIEEEESENADSFGKAQSIFSQTTQGTASSSSMSSINTQQPKSSANANAMQVDSVQPLSICMKSQNDLECGSINVLHQKTPSFLPPPPSLPMPHLS